MIQAATLSPAQIPGPTAIPTQPSSTLDTSLCAAFEHARRLTDLYGTANIDVAIAWETVEELQRAVNQQPQSAFARYCEIHPGAPECRIYDV